MAKRRKDVNGADDTVYMYYHEESKVIECHCGGMINGCHSCPEDMNGKKLQVVYCDFATCDYCQMHAKRKAYDDQWTDDEDGYNVCSDCHLKCDYDLLPKQCECEYDQRWDMDSDGNCICADCIQKCEYGADCSNCYNDG